MDSLNPRSRVPRAQLLSALGSNGSDTARDCEIRVAAMQRQAV